MIRYRAAPPTLILLVLWLTGCSSYSQIEAAQVADYGKARVTLDDGRRIVLAHPGLQADSLIGFRSNSWNEQERAYSDSIRVSLDRVATLEGSHFSAIKTFGLVGGLIGGLFAVAGIVCGTGDGCMGDFTKPAHGS